MTVVGPHENFNTPPLTVCDPSAHSSNRRMSSSTDDNGVAQVVVRLSRQRFAMAWFNILLLRGICAAFLLSFSRIYSLLTGEGMEYYARMLTTDPSFFKFPGYIFALLGYAHCYRMARMIGHSIQAKTLVFDRNHQNGMNMAKKNKWWCSFPFRSFQRLYRRLFGRRSCFGVESPYFELRFLVQECLEMASQSAQGYRSSVLIGKSWVNRSYVAIIFVNSWSTPVVQHFTRHSPVLERVMCFATDILLDSVTSMVLPVALIIPYYMKFDGMMYNFDYTFLYDDVWVVNLVMEARQVFACTYWDFITTFLPHVSIYGSLGSIECLLQPTFAVHGRQVMPHPRTRSVIRGKWKLRSKTLNLHLSSRLAQRIRSMQRYQLRDRQAFIVHLMFILWGLVVLLVHLWAVYANNSEISDDNQTIGLCTQRLHPWFASKTACSVYQYNCYRQGTTTPTEDSLAFLDEKSVIILSFTHCTELVVPKRIQLFSNLLCLDFWNSTIIAWDQGAAITEKTHPLVNYVGFILTNMTKLPDGILSDDLPQTLQDFEFVYTNLSDFPADLDTKWYHVNTLYIEYCGLTAAPDALRAMEISELSLVGNSLESFSPGQSSNYYSLAFSHNPLRDLDDNIGSGSYPMFLAVDHTLLEKFPEWVYAMAAADGTVYAFGTPFCENQPKADIANKYSNEIGLVCVNANPLVNGKYPLEMVRAMRKL